MSMIADQWLAFDERISTDMALVTNKLNVSYENLMMTPKAIILQIFSFLDLPTPIISTEGNTVIVNGRAFELINQNEAAISRLDTDTQNELQSRMKIGLEKHGY